MEDHVGIPDDMRCKRSDGKQWRCNALSMPDKTVCEKHYIQAKKRAANSALRASLKKAKKKSTDESDTYVDNKKDEIEKPLTNAKGGHEISPATTGKKSKEKVAKNQSSYAPKEVPVKGSVTRSAVKLNEDAQRDLAHSDDNKTKSASKLHPSIVTSRNKTPKSSAGKVPVEYSGKSTDSSGEASGQTCHQCQKSYKGKINWCMNCNRRGYCNSCLSKWYPDIPPEEIQRVCPVCRGTCNCKVCLCGDNLIKVRIQEIPGHDKLRYIHHLLSLVLPVLKQIDIEQNMELEAETKVHGFKGDVPRSKLNSDEQICCNRCGSVIVDYHRRCGNCSYDLCLACCLDVRQACRIGLKIKREGTQVVESGKDGVIHATTDPEDMDVDTMRYCLPCPLWKVNSDGSIPCPPEDYGGCGCKSLVLMRIFKINWIRKLEKDTEELVNGCKVQEPEHLDSCFFCLTSLPSESSQFVNSNLRQTAFRKDSTDNFLYYPSSYDIKLEGVYHFQKHWVRGEPVIVKHAFDSASVSSWDPMVIWRGIRETEDEKMRNDDRDVKSIDCLDWSEVEINLGQFLKGYSEGRIHENGWPEMLKLKDWPSQNSLEEFLSYQRAEFISTLPVLEYIHSKWGLLNLATKLPHGSLKSDLGPKISIAYGTYGELGRGDSTTKLHYNMGDVVYLLMHTCEVKFQGWQRAKIEKIQKTFRAIDAQASADLQAIETKHNVDEREKSPSQATERSKQDDVGCSLNSEAADVVDDHVSSSATELSGKSKSVPSERKEIGTSPSVIGGDNDALDRTRGGVHWDIFRRQDVAKLNEYLKVHWREFRHFGCHQFNSGTRPLLDQVVFLNEEHKRKLKEEFDVEPWTFEQQVGEAVFIPAGCPFQARNLQSCVQLSMNFLSPESLGESLRLAQEIRSLSDKHAAKQNMLQVGKMAVYSASWAIKEIQKLALDPIVVSEFGTGNPNLTTLLSENLEKMIKRRQITCI
ncbi:lysine-specific demethylase JMJ25 [Amborella trichopoda]|uniref:JmjC domain-containing protein n=1 Tax=Amborella trichopoda TaxID=13333 RepID=U5D9B0_AMBTC|nr:lysine-specific demethylase JMJ25 [Amborella trichopoda]XP_020529762.1 lysine-specific demethylase JMJ25 [Amborella trichopoda]XP_020529763.1 lysine-specific demethylase JMJ25 [Amborella trichopoda]ERN16983.1 hypothetical protein AMTR_s00057p00206860 [Amborella trichopoda]|eukprot:XP_006855516.1 lysine-specific demethylase JMJ25 [Amborella trichopoda]